MSMSIAAKYPLTALGAALLLGCSAEVGAPGPAPGLSAGGAGGASAASAESVASTNQDLSLQEIKDKIPPELRKFGQNASDVIGALSKLNGYAETAVGVLKFLGVLESGPSEFDVLYQKINDLVSGLDFKSSIVERDARNATFVVAVEAAKNGTLHAGDQMDINSKTALAELTGFAPPVDTMMGAFVRVPNEGATDGPWKSLLSDRAPVSNNVVYDWRIGIPELLNLVAMRLALIASMDPDVKNNDSWDAELLRYRAVLDAHRAKLEDGVRCRTIHDYWGTSHASMERQRTVCADIYTGQSVVLTESADHPPSPFGVFYLTDEQKARAENNRAIARDMVLRKLPIFELRAMSNAISLIANPRADITERDGQLLLPSSGYCLDQPNGDPVNLVSVQPCSGSPTQQFRYDRESGAIVHVSSGLCLDVYSESPLPGSDVGLWWCHGGDNQRWTYDSDTQLLYSPLSNFVLNGEFATGAVSIFGYTTPEFAQGEFWQAAQ